MTDDRLSPRVARLRARLEGLRPQVLEGVAAPDTIPVYHGSEPFHDAWMLHEGDPFVVRLAHAEAAWRSAVRPQLVPGHLILGTPPPACVVSYRTGVFAWDFLIDGRLAAAHPETSEVVANWRGWLAARPTPELPVPLSDPGVRGALMLHCPGAHSVQAFDLVLEGGLRGLEEKVAASRALHPEKADWFDALLICLEGVRAYILAHADACEQGARDTASGDAAEWRLLAANCRRIAHDPPVTFLQAAQLFELLFLLAGHDSPGRLDQYLWPPLQRELEAGTIDLELTGDVHELPPGIHWVEFTLQSN